MIESILAILSGLLGVAWWYLKRRAAQADANKPDEEEAARDADLVDPNPTALSVRLQRLYEKATRRRGGPGQPGA